MKVDSIIAVKDVEASSKWYQTVFGCRSMHGGDEFDVLVDENDEVLLCLHKWGEHNHPTMLASNNTSGNGHILYFRAENIIRIRENLSSIEYEIEKEIELSPNSRRKEFSLRDPDNYYIIVAEFHKYEG